MTLTTYVIILEGVSISEVTSGKGILVTLRKDLMKPRYMRWAHSQKYIAFSLHFYVLSQIPFGAFAHVCKLHKHTDWIRVDFPMLKPGEGERENICELPIEFQFCVKGFTKYCIYNHVFIHNRSALNEWPSLFYRLDNWVSKRLGIGPQVCPTPKPVFINTTFSCHHDLQLSLLILVCLSLKCNSVWQSSWPMLLP